MSAYTYYSDNKFNLRFGYLKSERYFERVAVDKDGFVFQKGYGWSNVVYGELKLLPQGYRRADLGWVYAMPVVRVS